MIASPPPHGVLGNSASAAVRFPTGLVGSTICGRYQIDALLDERTDCAQFRATNLGNRTDVILKIASPHASHDEHREFSRTASYLSELDHPRLQRVVDVNETEDGLPLLAIEALEGTPLDRLPTQPPPSALRLIAQVLEALRYLHSCKVVHANLTSARVLCLGDSTDEANIKLIELEASSIAQRRTITMGTLLSGAPGYVAPEQIVGAAFDHRADLYSVGVILFELLTGASPWGADKHDPLEKQLTQDLPPLPATLSDYDSLLARLCAREPTDRFPSSTAALSVVEELRRVAADKQESLEHALDRGEVVSSAERWLFESGSLQPDEGPTWPGKAMAPSPAAGGRAAKPRMGSRRWPVAALGFCGICAALLAVRCGFFEPEQRTELDRTAADIQQPVAVPTTPLPEPKTTTETSKPPPIPAEIEPPATKPKHADVPPPPPRDNSNRNERSAAKRNRSRSQKARRASPLAEPKTPEGAKPVNVAGAPPTKPPANPDDLLADGPESNPYLDG